MKDIILPSASADLLVQMYKNDPTMVKTLKESDNPLGEMERMAEAAKVESAKQEKAFRAVFLSDKQIYRAAVYVLGALALIAILGALILAALSVDIPESVVALGSAATGALVGLFADKPTGG